MTFDKDLSVGNQTISNGRYLVTKKLGVGAFGEVYRAQDTVLSRTVALKRIRLDRLTDSGRFEELRARFLREAQVAAQLHHVNIIAVYDVVSLEDTSFLIMEYVEGKTLQQCLASKKVLSLSEVVHILSQVAEALHHAHERKVVHRDVKPANVLITDSGLVKVGDFGIAKSESSGNLTTDGSILGTPDYMSPEQARGRAADGRSDLFSLGCIFYECLTGKAPFHAPRMTEVLLRIVTEEPEPIDCEKRGLPVDVQSVVDRSLAKDPSKRFSSGKEFIQALRSLPAAELRGPAFSLRDVQATVPKTRTPDSVADSLLREARRTTGIEAHLTALMQETRSLRKVASPLLQFRNVSLTPEEAFILSRVEGEIRPREIFVVSPLSEQETARALIGFLRTGLVGFAEDPRGGNKKDNGGEAATDEERRREIERFFETYPQQDDWQVLGLAPGASPEEIKRAFQEKAFRYHPDRYRSGANDDLQEKLSRLFHRVSDAYANLSGPPRTGATH